MRRSLFPSFSCPTAADPEGTFASSSADRGRKGPPGLDFTTDSYIFAASNRALDTTPVARMFEVGTGSLPDTTDLNSRVQFELLTKEGRHVR